MPKRRKKKATKESNILNYIAWFLALIALALLALAGGYYIGSENTKKELAKQEEEKKQRRAKLLKKIEDTNTPTVQSVRQRLQEVLKEEARPQKESNISIVKKEEEKHLSKLSADLKKEVLKVKKYVGASHEYASNSLAKPPSRVKRKAKIVSSNKPRLAIIIDDVSVKSQVKAIKALNLVMTMSFLPPSPARPNSATLAAKESFYMVHLPMEAQSYSAEEPKTLRISHSQGEVSSRIASIKKMFPKVLYINNHTGSKYTSDEKAMNRLIVSLNANNISFIDSRTTSKTQVPKVMENFALKYVSRDVFLDHHMEKEYVIGQIKEAVRIAKSEGVAIAIGHPHKNTIAALRESKHLFKDVELVLINKVY